MSQSISGSILSAIEIRCGGTSKGTKADLYCHSDGTFSCWRVVVRRQCKESRYSCGQEFHVSNLEDHKDSGIHAWIDATGSYKRAGICETRDEIGGCDSNEKSHKYGHIAAKREETPLSQSI